MDNKEMIQAVAHILAIDGEFNQQERSFLENLCTRLHVSHETMTDILEQAKNQKGTTVAIPESPGEKTLLFSMLIQAAATDAIISPQERNVLQEVGINIGMTPDEISRAISSIEISFPSQSHHQESKQRKQFISSISPTGKRLNPKVAITIGMAVIVIICSVIGGVSLLNSVTLLPPEILQKIFSGGSTTFVLTPLNYNPKPIDKLFTAFAFMPILDYKYNYNGTDLMGRFFDDVSKKVLKGYCVRQYEVGIGYDSVKDLFPQYKEFACRGEFQKMPVPQILSTNPKKTDTQGEYTLNECTLWDAEPTVSSEERKSHKQLKEELKLNGQWAMITENSQKMLMGYMRIYCDIQ